MSEKNYPEDGYNDLLSALASKPNKPQWLNTFVRTLQSRDVTLETWNSLINVISNIASDTVSISDFLQILYKNCVWSVKGSASLEEKIGNVILELSDFGISIDVSKINRAVYANGNTIYNKDGVPIKLTNINFDTNSVDTSVIAVGAVTLDKLNSAVINRLSQIDTKVSKVTPGTMPKVYTMMPDGVEMGFPATFNKDATTFVYRDVNGRAKFADPSDIYDASNKNYVDTKVSGSESLLKTYTDTKVSDLKTYADNKTDAAKADMASYTDIAVAGIVNSAPETLDTLQELSKALGNDPNFATTIATELGKKAVKTEVDAALETKLDKSNVAQTTGQSETMVMSQKAVTDKLYSEAELIWEDGALDGSTGNEYSTTSVVCRTKGYIDARAIHSISVIKSKLIFAYDEKKTFIGYVTISANSTFTKSDILALGDVRYIRLKSSWGESAATVDKVTIYEDANVKAAIEQSDKVDEKYSNLVIKECPMNWKGVFYEPTTGEYGTKTSLFVTGDRIKLLDFVKAVTGNNLYFRVYVYDENKNYLGYLNKIERGGTLLPKVIYEAYPTAGEIILSMFYASNLETPVSDVEQYTTVYCSSIATAQATTDYWRKQRQRFNDKPIMVAYSQTDLGSWINSELNYVNNAIVGFRWLKGDVQPTSDGKLIMCHDDGFTFNNDGYIGAYNATSENTRAIHDMTYEECMASEYAQEFHIRTEYGEVPTKITYRPKVCDLEKFLIVCKEYEVRPYIVIRSNYMDVVIPELLRLLEAYDFLDNCIVNSFDINSVAEVARQSNHRVMISLVKEYAQGTALTVEEVDNLLAVSPNCTINIFTGSTTAEWNNVKLVDASKNAINYAKSLGIVVGTAFSNEPHLLFARGIGLMQCQTICIPIKVTPINLCIALKNGVATMRRYGVYGAEYTADIADFTASSKSITLYNIRKIGSTRDFSDGITPNLAYQMPYSLTVSGDNVTGATLNWHDVIIVNFDTKIADLDTSSEKRILVKFAYGISDSINEINNLKSDLAGKASTDYVDNAIASSAVSPTVATETITGGTKVTITDKDGAHEFDVMNGVNGATGKSAYASAQDGGFTGTEAQFNNALSVIGDVSGIDTTVTQNSGNLITSGAVVAYITGKAETWTFTLADGSTVTKQVVVL